jgi:hypothetical protein
VRMKSNIVALLVALTAAVNAEVTCEQYDNSGYAVRWPLQNVSSACPIEAPIKCSAGLTNRCCPTGTVCYVDGPAWCCPRGMNTLECRNSVVEWERVCLVSSPPPLHSEVSSKLTDTAAVSR